MISGVKVPSLVTLLEADVLMKRLLLLTELGVMCWFNEFVDVVADVVDFGCVVVLVISEPIEALPLSELALQFPLEEWSSFPVPFLRCLI